MNPETIIVLCQNLCFRTESLQIFFFGHHSLADLQSKVVLLEFVKDFEVLRLGQILYHMHQISCARDVISDAEVEVISESVHANS